MAKSWRFWNRVLHRDLGYVFFGATIIYAVSGIALNHIDDWNPSYSVTQEVVRWEGAGPEATITEDQVLAFLDDIGEGDAYKKHYKPNREQLKIFVKSGSVVIDLYSGKGVLEKLERRPLLYEFNFLHYNPKRLWTWYSDIYCVALIIVAVTGLLVIKGKKGITGRGAWLTGVGAIVPLILLWMYL